jgi:hypothetical protein
VRAMLRKLSEAEILKLSYGDAELVSLTWRGDDAEPTFVVTLRRGEGAAERTIVLAFTWPYVDVELNSKHGFRLLSWEGSFRRLDDGHWKISLDFAHPGAISVTCNDVYLEDS